jgi:hypothetical protein
MNSLIRNQEKFSSLFFEELENILENNHPYSISRRSIIDNDYHLLEFNVNTKKEFINYTIEQLLLKLNTFIDLNPSYWYNTEHCMYKKNPCTIAVYKKNDLFAIFKINV